MNGITFGEWDPRGDLLRGSTGSSSGSGWGYQDPFGAYGDYEALFGGEAGSAVEATRAGLQGRISQFQRSTGGLGGSLATAFAAGRAQQEVGAEVARQRREEFLQNLAAKTQFLQPEQGAVAGAWSGASDTINAY